MSFRGQSLPRLEDERFLTGRGEYIEDINFPGQAWMHVVRSRMRTPRSGTSTRRTLAR